MDLRLPWRVYERAGYKTASTVVDILDVDGKAIAYLGPEMTLTDVEAREIAQAIVTAVHYFFNSQRKGYTCEQSSIG